MQCPKCQFENVDGAKFCNECGCRLETSCPECSKNNPPGSKFCNECGHNLHHPVEPSLKDLVFFQLQFLLEIPRAVVAGALSLVAKR